VTLDGTVTSRPERRASELTSTCCPDCPAHGSMDCSSLQRGGQRDRNRDILARGRLVDSQRSVPWNDRSRVTTLGAMVVLTATTTTGGIVVFQVPGFLLRCFRPRCSNLAVLGREQLATTGKAEFNFFPSLAPILTKQYSPVQNQPRPAHRTRSRSETG
jgi:hypothetical protein